MARPPALRRTAAAGPKRHYASSGDRRESPVAPSRRGGAARRAAAQRRPGARRRRAMARARIEGAGAGGRPRQARIGAQARRSCRGCGSTAADHGHARRSRNAADARGGGRHRAGNLRGGARRRYAAGPRAFGRAARWARRSKREALARIPVDAATITPDALYPALAKCSRAISRRGSPAIARACRRSPARGSGAPGDQSAGADATRPSHRLRRQESFATTVRTSGTIRTNSR